MKKELLPEKDSATKKLRGIGYGILTIFLLLTIAIDRGQLVSRDFDLSVKIQDKVPNVFDPVFHWIVYGGSMEILTTALVFVLILLPIQKRQKLGLFFLYVAGLALVLIGKEFLHHPAPPYSFNRDEVTFTFPSSFVHTQYSYPSGHTFRAVFLASVLACYSLIQEKKYYLRIALLSVSGIIAFFIPVSMLVLGKHWSTDIIGGALLACGLVCSTWTKRRNTSV